MVAHPDDESFALGALLSGYAAHGVRTAVLCFTRGEASTLNPGGREDLGRVRAQEFSRAARILAVDRAVLLDYPDGRLSAFSLPELTARVRDMIDSWGATRLLAFDAGGVTGHPDHVRATEAALTAAEERGVPVLGWTLPTMVADRLTREFGIPFHGRALSTLDQSTPVDRAAQRRAIACHRSQSADNPVLYRRLELLGDFESVVLLGGTARPSGTSSQDDGHLPEHVAQWPSPVECPRRSRC
ncbi:PIG-L deacetylase family protein [Phaeacidiphilus oryzae]|uniref:PIG-L deacetylase family protein n=1 Tax=Phaeacidiphilus oryzae TaxID=348818 RepID=UPI00190F97E8|nr:PIG-L family deacetylase [Phaeacidiphilus oryzae]